MSVREYKIPGPEDINNAFNILLGDKPDLSLLRFPNLIRTYVCSSPEAFENVLSMTPRSAVDDVDATGSTTLFWAVQRGDYDAVRKLLLCGSDPGHVNSFGRAPLYEAVDGGDVACVRLLLEANADVNSKDFEGNTALHLAAQRRNTTLIELLLSCGAIIESQNTLGYRALHCAVWYDIPPNLRLLLEGGAKINAATNLGMTPLMFGVLWNAHEALKVLLREEALECNSKDFDGYSVLDYAALGGDLETLHLLQSSQLMKTADLDDGKALGYAMWRRDNNEARSLGAVRAMDEDSLLWYSAFEALWDSIVEAQQRDLEVDSEEWERSVEEALTDDDDDEQSSELGDDDDYDDEESELYEDAQKRI